MRLKTTYLAVLTTLLLCSCGTARRATEHESTLIIVRDSVYLRDTVVRWLIPDESREAIVDTVSHLETSLAESDARIVEGRLHHILRNRGGERIPVVVSIPVRRVTSSTERLRVVTVTRDVPARLTWWQHTWIRLGKLLSAVLAVAVTWVLIRWRLR